jgi:hypothetical protein
MQAHLPEVLEEDALGTVAQTYAEIRTVLAVPVVNLIYRHLAAEPGRLEATWDALRPNLAHPGIHALAAELARTADLARPHVVAVERHELIGSGVSSDDLRGARATLAVYERANSLNLLGVSALLRGTLGSEETDAVPAPAWVRAGDVLPMADPASLDESTQEILEKLSAAIAQPDDEVVFPSLYRHLAARPALLRLIWAHVGDALGASELGSAAAVVREQAATLARRLPCRVDAVSDPDVRAVLKRFALAMATMLVAGRTVEEALGGAE